MKTISLLLISLVFLPFSALATGNCITNTDLDQVLTVVRDTEGNPLNKDSRYFIVSAFWGAGGGGVRLAHLGDQEQNNCSTEVVQSPWDRDKGIAVYFKPENLKQKEIVQSSPINIKFYLDTDLCANLTVWKVDNYPNPKKPHTVSTGAKLENPLDINSWFQIKHLGDEIYKLVFCPYGEKFNCQNIGITNGDRRLILSETPKAFVFEHDKSLGMAIA